MRLVFELLDELYELSWIRTERNKNQAFDSIGVKVSALE